MESPPEPPASRTTELVERARGGDREAFGELVELMWAPLVGLARTILAGDDEAEDVVQEALVQAWKRLGTLRDDGRFAAWTRRIVARRCYAQLRRRPPAAPLPEPAVAAPPAADHIDVARLLARLAPRQRAVVHLTMIEGRSAREAAAMLGILPATARVHRHRALKRLRRALEEGK